MPARTEDPPERPPNPLKGAYIPANRWMAKPPLGGWGSLKGQLGVFQGGFWGSFKGRFLEALFGFPFCPLSSSKITSVLGAQPEKSHEAANTRISDTFANDWLPMASVFRTITEASFSLSRGPNDLAKGPLSPSRGGPFAFRQSSFEPPGVAVSAIRAPKIPFPICFRASPPPLFCAIWPTRPDDFLYAFMRARLPSRLPPPPLLRLAKLLARSPCRCCRFLGA